MQQDSYAEDCEASNSSSGEDSQASDSVMLSPRKLHNKWLDVSRSRSKIQVNFCKSKTRRTIKYLSRSVSSHEIETECTDKSSTRLTLSRYGADDLKICDVDYGYKNKKIKSKMYHIRNKGARAVATRAEGASGAGGAGDEGGEGGAGGEGVPFPRHPPSVGDGEPKRAFPFSQTPSGNLKVLRNQVVFESENVSVLVADPNNTKVKMYADANNVSKENFEDRTPAQFCLKLTTGNFDKDTNESVSPANGNSYCPSTQSNYDDDYEPSQLQKEYSLQKISSTSLPIVDWNKTLLPYKTELFTRLLHRITNYINPDVEILISHEVFSCHLLVLQCYSEYFDQTKQASKVRLPEGSVTPRSFSIIYKWMIYPGSDSFRLLSRENILEVFIASQYLSVKELEEQCWTFINSDYIFSEETAFLLYLRAKEMNNITITQLMVPRIMRFFLKLVGTTNFVELDLEDISLILCSNFIAVHNEIEVFMSAVRWLMHDWAKRKEHITDLMQCVRFGWIAPWQLVDIRRNPENPEFMRVTSSTNIQQLVEDGLSYAIIKYWYGNQTQDYYHWIDILGLQEPTQRNWIDEEKNYVTYREFLSDLALYQQPGALDNIQLRSQQVNLSHGSFPPPPTVAEFMAHRERKSEVETDLEQSESNLEEKSRCEEEHLSQHNASNIKSGIEFQTLFHNSEQSSSKHQEIPLQQINIQNRCHNYSQSDNCKIIEERKNHTIPDNNIKNVRNFGCLSPSKSDPLHLSTKENSLKQDERISAGLNRESISLESNIIQRKQEHAKFVNVSTSESEVQGKEDILDKTTSKTNAGNSQLHKIKEFSRLPHYIHSTSILNANNKNYLMQGSLFYPNEESVLVFGGIDPHHAYGVGRNRGKDIYRYRPHINSWELVGELPEPRHHHSVAILRGKVFLVGGADPRDDDEAGKSVIVGSVWSFDPITRVWYNESEMLIPRKNFGLVVSNSKLYAIGGQDKNGRILSSVECFDPKCGQWREVASLSVGRMGVAAAKFRDFIWVAGGMANSKSSSLNDTIECYDTRRNVWLPLGKLCFPRCFGNLFSMNDTLYLIGGAGYINGNDGSATSVGSIDVWNDSVKALQPIDEMAIPRHGHSSAYLGTQILVIGGVTTMYMRALSNVECYCCVRETWIHGVANLPTPLSGHGSVTLPPAALM